MNIDAWYNLMRDAGLKEGDKFTVTISCEALKEVSRDFVAPHGVNSRVSLLDILTGYVVSLDYIADGMENILENMVGSENDDGSLNFKDMDEIHLGVRLIRETVQRLGGVER